MIVFITNKQHKVVEVENELQIRNTFTPQDVELLKNLSIIGIDLETNHLDPFLGNILLLIIGNEDVQYVVDVTDTQLFILSNLYLDELNKMNKLFIGANVKFDYKFIKTKWNVSLNRMYDVMIAEQRLNQGKTEFSLKYNKRINLSAALDKIVLRRLGVVPTGMDKSIRDEFVGANPNTFQFENKHIVYAANDINQLFKLRIIQKDLIKHYGQEFLIYNIEFPLIKVLADCELNGLDINEQKWKENIVKNEDLKFITECELDVELRKLRDEIIPVNERIWLSTGKYDKVRLKPNKTIVQDNLFGELFNDIEVNNLAKVKKKVKDTSPYINYSSTEQIVTILGRLKQPAPTKEGLYYVPTFKVKRTSKQVKYVVDKSLASFTTNAKAIESYKIDNPDSPIKTFITKLINLRTYNTRLNTFGENFLIKFKNKITKKFHTIYRQCDALTGRLQSGDEKNGWYNSQNIPREKDYRIPFHYENYDIITTDLSGAEAVIMIDKARDEKFYEMAIVNDDAHSPLAQAVWRTIGTFRKDAGLANIVISKKENKDMRTAYKPMTFGDIYGMGIKKRAKTLGVSEEEAKIAGDVQKSMIPKTYAMVNTNAKFAITNGYLILNSRTNSRIWFSEILEAKKNNSSISNEDKYNIESTAKNAPIQGTQADMVKEIMVEIHKEAVRQNLYKPEIDLKLLKQVHDETVYACKNANYIVEFINDKKEIINVPIHEFINKMHSKICNRYLSFITMGAETNVEKTWTK